MSKRALSSLVTLFALALLGLAACGGNNGNSCDEGFTDCNGVCVNANADNDNCGVCGVVCEAGYACMAGTCESICPPDQLQCGGNCVDPATDVNYCGAQGDCAGPNAGQDCANNYECNGGACECGAPYIECAVGTCVNLETDVGNCGACYNQCAPGASCVEGVCRAAVTYAGALTQSNGRWLYGNEPGLVGANAECSANWANARVCTEDEIFYASQNGELIGAVDTAGTTVGSFWLENENRPDNQQCVNSVAENTRWTYPTADLMHYGYYAALDNATGVLDVPTEGFCNSGMYHVPCCYEASVIQ